MKNKIKKEQLEKIKSHQEELNKIINEIGVLETTKHSYLHHVAEINKEVEIFKKELEEEYGEVNIDLTDGSYKPIDKKEK